MWNISGFIDPSFPLENVKTIFISKPSVGKAGVSPTSWQVYGNPSLRDYRASMCYTIQKMMFRKSLIKVGGSYWNRQQGCPKSSLSSCYMLVQSAHGIGEAETNLCSIEEEFHRSRSGSKHQKRWLLSLVIPACSSSFFVFIMKEFIMPLAVSYLTVLGAVLCCLGCTWRVWAAVLDREGLAHFCLERKQMPNQQRSDSEVLQLWFRSYLSKEKIGSLTYFKDLKNRFPLLNFCWELLSLFSLFLKAFCVN